MLYRFFDKIAIGYASDLSFIIVIVLFVHCGRARFPSVWLRVTVR